MKALRQSAEGKGERDRERQNDRERPKARKTTRLNKRLDEKDKTSTWTVGECGCDDPTPWSMVSGLFHHKIRPTDHE